MPSTLTYPGVYVEEIPSGVRTITGVATSITAFVGRALRGPVEKATTVNSFGDFVSLFGRVGQDGHMVRLDLQETAADGEVLLVAGSSHHDLAEVKHGQQRAVVGQDAHPALNARQVDRVDLAAENDSFLSDDVTLNWHIIASRRGRPACLPA